MYIETAIVATLAGVMVKILDVLYLYIKKKTISEKCDPKLGEMLNIIKQIHELLHKTDEDGVYLTYVPRRLITQQEGYNELLRNLTHNSEVVSKTLDKLTVTLESITRVLIQLEDRTSHSK